MKKKLKFLGVILLSSAMFFGCGQKSNVSSQEKKQEEKKPEQKEEFFEWEGNEIKGLTEEGKKQKEIVIPARCEGLQGFPFHDTEVESVRFESDKDIPLNAALSLSNLKTIELPAELTVIGDQEFWYCEALEQITIPGKVKSIGTFAFQQCTALKEVRVEGESLTTIGNYVFDLCPSLERMNLPDSVTDIGKSVFENRRGMKGELTLPKSIKRIGDKAFLNTEITDVYIPEEVELEEIHELSFGAADISVTAHIKQGSWCDQNFDTVLAPVFGQKSYD